LSDSGVLTENIRVTSDGRLGIGTDSPDTQLHVQGDGYFSSDVEVFKKLTVNGEFATAPININIMTLDPSLPSDGDFWITDSSGSRKLNVRISGVTYHVLLTV
jgi:hypothetical protein